jgi:DNA polymerase (family 10)
VDNAALAQVFAEIADLMEIRGDNAFKIRAYRSAADTIRAWSEGVSRLSDEQLRELPGVGRDLAAKIRELAETGACQYHQELLQQFPATILDLLKLPGIGPKTVALLHSVLHISSVEELAAAAQAGRLRDVKGMGAKKEAQILKAIEERRRDAGRHLLSNTAAMAGEIVRHLQAACPGTEFIPVGSLRRGAETCGDIDILAVGAPSGVMEHFTAFTRVTRVLVQGENKTSVLIDGSYQADLRAVPVESRGAAMQYFTGSKAHNIVVRDRAVQRGLKLNEYGLYRVEDNTRIAGDTEEDIYAALGMAWVEPELREQRGELDAAVAGSLPRLITAADLRGDLHMHTTVTDGRDDLETMAAAAQRAGYEYIAITDHSKALAMANGLDETRALAHAAHVRSLNGRFEGLTLLAGIECDILADGQLDLADDCLAQLDIVVASIHSHFNQDEAQMTDRILRALECPWVDVLGHPTGRRLLRREPARMDMNAVMSAAAAKGVALEINSQVDRLDLNDANARMARDRGVMLVVSTDAHSTAALHNIRWGIHMARRGWAEPRQVLNTYALPELRARLRRHRTV